MNNILTANEIRTAVYYKDGREIKVHAIQTGLISVKENFRKQKGKGFMSKLNIVFGKDFTEFMPIWVWVIEHPEGIIVIDTGDIEESVHPDFYKKESLGTRLSLRAMSSKRIIGKRDGLDAQLNRLGIKPEQVSKVVLTHLHGDHT
ncbi:MAG TPA: MBL fold metallo-hydrolase, partial [Puia sp.]